MNLNDDEGKGRASIIWLKAITLASFERSGNSIEIKGEKNTTAKKRAAKNNERITWRHIRA